jgi:hypothetical protein
MTLLQQVRLRPVLPALNEIKMTLISELLRIASSACSRLSALMLPSSKAITRISCNRWQEGRSIPTSYVFDTSLLEEWFDNIQERSELNGHKVFISIRTRLARTNRATKYLGEDDGLLRTIRSIIDLPKNVQRFPNLGATRRHARGGVRPLTSLAHKALTVVASSSSRIFQAVYAA